jgi:hypothetical protein
MIFVDSNIPMYIIGAAHPNKAPALQIIERCISMEERLVTDTEAFQEILHRYGALDRQEAIQPAFEVLAAVVDEILPMEYRDVQRAKELLLGSVRLSARDAVHLAIMERHGVDRIVSFDRGFDDRPGVRRIGSAAEL